MPSRIDVLRTRFLTEFAYTKDAFKSDYLAEVKNFDLANWDAPRRAARLSAAVKNYKTSEMLTFLFSICVEESVDLTPLVVKRLCVGWFNRSGSQKVLVALFGEKGRVHKSADSPDECIQLIVDKYRNEADKHWKQCMDTIKAIKLAYKVAIRSQ